MSEYRVRIVAVYSPRFDLFTVKEAHAVLYLKTPHRSVKQNRLVSDSQIQLI